MRTISTAVTFALAAGLVGGCQSPPPDESLAIARLSGAIFTTLVDGTRVDANIYEDKDDVYLDGGPGPNAPQGAASLPDGDYYFQVTDPSGMMLLSEDAIGCRRFTISDGVITSVRNSTPGCVHRTGPDVDHNALTVQLMPYADTPNPGGEYKVWITSVEKYDEDEGTHGFLNNYSKTDNFKVEHEEECGDNNVGEGEECDDGNNVDGDGCDKDCKVEHEPCCGDGKMEGDEECDDGNTVDGDGCDKDCKIEHEPCCGDGKMEGNEECDDGNQDDGDGCSATCTIESHCPPPT